MKMPLGKAEQSHLLPFGRCLGISQAPLPLPAYQIGTALHFDRIVSCVDEDSRGVKPENDLRLRLRAVCKIQTFARLHGG